MTEEEKVLLSINNPEQIFQQAKQGIGKLKKLQGWLPNSLPVNMLRNARGAGGIRLVGRFSLFASLEVVRQRLGSALNSILKIQQELKARLGTQAQSVQVDTIQHASTLLWH